MIKNIITFSAILLLANSCISTKLTIKNIDNKAPNLVLLPNNTFELKAISTDKRYGYDKDYPINLFFQKIEDNVINQERFLNALAGPRGEKLSFKKLENCCPFPTKTTEMGAGLLDVYEIWWDGLAERQKLYLNKFEKGILMAPMGLTIKK